MNKNSTIDLMQQNIRITQIIYPNLWKLGQDEVEFADQDKFYSGISTGVIIHKFFEKEFREYFKPGMTNEQLFQARLQCICDHVTEDQFFAHIETPVRSNWNNALAQWFLARSLEDLHQQASKFKNQINEATKVFPHEEENAA